MHFANKVLSKFPLGGRLARSRTLRAWSGFEDTIWTRKVSDEVTRQIVLDLNPEALDVLEISGQRWSKMGFRSFQMINYPEVDICEDLLPDRYDLVIAEHIFEHLLRPYKAGRNVHEMLNPDGHFLMVTPFIYKVHENPVDCTRWTETGIKHFLAECGFSIDKIKTGSWGNRKCIEATFRREFRLFNKYLHSLNNEPELPIVVWALAQK